MRTEAAALFALLLGVSAGTASAVNPGTVKGTITTAAGEPGVNAVVMLEGPSVPAQAAAQHAVMDQRHESFSPHVLAVPVGTTVDFPNDDPTLHNVFSTSTVKKFDLGMYEQGKRRSVTFDTPGIVRVNCNVHPKMEAYIVVHQNPYAAVTDAQGSYTIGGIPAGSYRLRVWHESLGEKELPVTVRDGESTPVDVRLGTR